MAPAELADRHLLVNRGDLSGADDRNGYYHALSVRRAVHELCGNFRHQLPVTKYAGCECGHEQRTGGADREAPATYRGIADGIEEARPRLAATASCSMGGDEESAAEWSTRRFGVVSRFRQQRKQS